MMRARPMFKYPGSKWQLSAYYPRPAHDLIVEPFAGSACYSLRYRSRRVILIEKNPEIVALWRYLISADANEIANLPTTSLKRGDDIRLLDVSDGAKLLIRQWQRVGTSSCWTVSDWCNKPGQWGNATRDSLAESVETIRHWQILSGDANCFLNPGDPVGARFRGDERVRFVTGSITWFFDPPYIGLPLFGSKDIDYSALARRIQNLPGQAIVCEQASATWLPFRPFRLSTTGRRGESSKGPSKEGIWTSADVYNKQSEAR